MPAKETKRDRVCAWLEKSGEDLAVAQRLLGTSSQYSGIIGFHAQQAVEKLLKALLLAHDVAFPKTHDLALLLDLVARVEPLLAESLLDAEHLTPYSVTARYPAYTKKRPPMGAEAAVRLAILADKVVRKALRPYLRGKA